MNLLQSGLRLSIRLWKRQPYRHMLSWKRHLTHHSTSDNNKTETEQKHPLEEYDSLPSAVISNYWDEIMRYADEPEHFQLGHSSAEDETRRFQADSIADFRKLVNAVVRTGRQQGDIWPSLLTKQCVDFYERLDIKGRARLLEVLANDFGVELTRVTASANAFIEMDSDESDKTREQRLKSLRESVVPLYEHFFDRIHQLPGGMQFLIRVRADLMSIMKENKLPLFRTLNESLARKLRVWCGIGFLDLEKITWNTSASILEKIIRYEAVHQIPSWDALKQRLGPGRLCYAFFHRNMPLEPLVFVQTALVKHIPNNIHEILSDTTPETKEPKVAVFYSISSTQKGLSGVDLGNFLIKRVVKEVQKYYPHVQSFCTLSPIPGFRSWLTTKINYPESESRLLLQDEIITLDTLRPYMTEFYSPQSLVSPMQMFWSILQDEKLRWVSDQKIQDVIRPILTRLCSRYILLEKKRTFALDPVTNFHIRNGASVQRLNWLGDKSDKGLKQSFGMMINYVYELPHVEANNQSYVLDGQIALYEPIDSMLMWAVRESQQKQKL